MSPSLGKYLVFRGLQFNLQVGGGGGGAGIFWK